MSAEGLFAWGALVSGTNHLTSTGVASATTSSSSTVAAATTSSSPTIEAALVELRAQGENLKTRIVELERSHKILMESYNTHSHNLINYVTPGETSGPTHLVPVPAKTAPAKTSPAKKP